MSGEAVELRDGWRFVRCSEDLEETARRGRRLYLAEAEHQCGPMCQSTDGPLTSHRLWVWRETPDAAIEALVAIS